MQSLVLSYAQVTQKTASKHTAATTNSSNKSECLLYFYHKMILRLKLRNILFLFTNESRQSVLTCNIYFVMYGYFFNVKTYFLKFSSTYRAKVTGIRG